MPQSFDALDYELNAERAFGLGRSGRRLARALAALREFDRGEAGQAASREALLAEAAEACWAYLVQREIIGLGFGDAQYIRTEYAVPNEVWRRLGPKMRT